jgi:hypothetical protein
MQPDLILLIANRKHTGLNHPIDAIAEILEESRKVRCVSIYLVVGLGDALTQSIVLYFELR